MKRFSLALGVAVLTLGSSSASSFAAVVGYWPMNEGSGTVINNTQTGPNGALTNMAANDWIAGRSGAVGDRALDLDGANDYISFGTSAALNPSFNQPFSVQTWVYDRNSGGTMGLFTAINPNGPFDGWGLVRRQIGGVNTVRFEMGGVDGKIMTIDAPSGSLPINKWTHVVATYDGSRDANGMKIYLNGVLAPTTIANNTLVPTSASPSGRTATLGSYGGENRYFNGVLDEAAFWDEVVTPAAVLQLSAGASPLAIPKVVDISSKFNRDTIRNDNTEPVGGGYRNNGDKFVTEAYNGVPNIPNDGVVRAGNQAFVLGDFQTANAQNTWILGLNETSTLALNVGPATELSVLFSAVGYNVSGTNDGTLTVTFADGATQQFLWDVRDSDGAGSGGLALDALAGLDLDRNGSPVTNAQNNRRWYYQTFALQPNAGITSLAFSTVGVVDGFSNDAEFGIYALNYTPLATPVPEPASLVLCAALVGLLPVLRRRRAT